MASAAISKGPRPGGGGGAAAAEGTSLVVRNTFLELVETEDGLSPVEAQMRRRRSDGLLGTSLESFVREREHATSWQKLPAPPLQYGSETSGTTSDCGLRTPETTFGSGLSSSSSTSEEAEDEAAAAAAAALRPPRQRKAAGARKPPTAPAPPKPAAKQPSQKRQKERHRPSKSTRLMCKRVATLLGSGSAEAELLAEELMQSHGTYMQTILLGMQQQRPVLEAEDGPSECKEKSNPFNLHPRYLEPHSLAHAIQQRRTGQSQRPTIHGA